MKFSSALLTVALAAVAIMGLMSIAGNVDLLFAVFLADVAFVRSCLPPRLRDSLCSNAVVNESLKHEVAVPEGKHPIVIVLSRLSDVQVGILPVKVATQVSTSAFYRAH